MTVIAASPVTRPIDATSNHVESIVEIFRSDREKILPSNFSPDVDYDQLLKAIDTLSVCVAWMIYFSSGGPYCFQEITMLRASGPGRTAFLTATPHVSCCLLPILRAEA